MTLVGPMSRSQGGGSYSQGKKGESPGEDLARPTGGRRRAWCWAEKGRDIMITGQPRREIGRPSVADDRERRHYRLVVDRSEGTMRLQNPRLRGTTPFGRIKDSPASGRRAGGIS